VCFLLSEKEFDLLRSFIHGQAGIFLGPQKREMLKARLSKRLRALGIPSFQSYYEHLQATGPAGEEWVHCINAVTTNVTGFYREAHHFRFLEEKWLPELRARAESTPRKLRIWSAGCSTGEEPYSIAMSLCESLGPVARIWDTRILASDIDTEALQRAHRGVYPMDRLSAVPPDLVPRYFLRGTGNNTGLVQVRPTLQAQVAFRRINLMEEPWPIHTRFDAIFCRNVMIYFDRDQQRRLIERFRAFLKEGGLLFLGHSESLHGWAAGLKHVQNTVYQAQSHAPARGSADCAARFVSPRDSQ
jgi:chemotaxis protein methyltransferase CheR